MRTGILWAAIFAAVLSVPAAAQPLAKRDCNAGRLGPAGVLECEARNLDDEAGAAAAKARGFEDMARASNDGCDAKGQNKEQFVGCDMGAKDMLMEAGFLRQEATEKFAAAERKRAEAKALLDAQRAKQQGQKPAGTP